MWKLSSVVAVAVALQPMASLAKLGEPVAEAESADPTKFHPMEPVIPEEPPEKQECKRLMISALEAAGIPYRFGGWEYGGLGSWDLWPGGAVECAKTCEYDAECYHWDFDCSELLCKHYGNSGFEEDGDAQFGRDFWFLGDSSRVSKQPKPDKGSGKTLRI